mmetsp:Transcript_2955/g.7085  ORF Transcript_2955/g.7085 Transcript_2955/m.7085 type:complete len:140 (-) Transcript_2955:332-751(-)
MAIRRCKRAGLLVLSLLLGALRLAFVNTVSPAASRAPLRAKVAMKVGPVPVQLPFMSEPIDGATFALYMGAIFISICLFGAFQLWRLFFSEELGSYEEIKWGGARPPKEYVEEMKRLDERRKRRYLDLKSVREAREATE